MYLSYVKEGHKYIDRLEKKWLTKNNIYKFLSYILKCDFHFWSYSIISEYKKYQWFKLLIQLYSEDIYIKWRYDLYYSNYISKYKLWVDTMRELIDLKININN